MDVDPRVIYEDALSAALSPLGVSLSEDQRERLWRHRALVVEANERFNLTRITAPDEFAVKHHADALTVVRWCRDADASVSRVLDVGTGAGVPAVPLAIACPQWRVTGIDGTAKKAHFVAEVARALCPDNLAAHHGRAETWRAAEPFDLVLFKAVGSLARTLEFGRPHLARRGRLVVFRTETTANDEVAAAAVTAVKLGLERVDVYRCEIPLRGTPMKRSLWVYGLAGG